MKKYLLLIVTLVLGVALTIILFNKVGLAQAINGDTPAAFASSSEPEQTSPGEIIPWNSSMDVPEGFKIESPPDNHSTTDSLDAEDRATYNASLGVAGSVLRARAIDSVTVYSAFGGGGCLYVGGGGEYRVFNTPVYLPQGSTVKYFRMYFNDTNASTNSSAFFTVYDFYGNVDVEYEINSSGSAGQGYSTTDEITEVIDYESYSYVINWRPNVQGMSMQVCGFQIYYQAPSGATFLPLIINGE